MAVKESSKELVRPARDQVHQNATAQNYRAACGGVRARARARTFVRSKVFVVAS